MTKNTWLYPLAMIAVLDNAGCDAPDGIDEFDDLAVLDSEGVADEPLDEVDQAEEDIDIDPPSPDGSNGNFVSEQDPSAISGMGYWSWGTPGNNGAPLYLGPSHDRTCFLQGVTGELESAMYTSPAKVSVYEQNGSWWLETDAGTTTFYGEGGHGVMGHATCIPATANRRFITWVGNSSNGSNTLYSWREDTGFTKCFLTGVSGTVGWVWSDTWAAVERWPKWDNGVKTDGWLLHGDLEQQQNGSSGGGATAVCVDIWFQNSGEYSWQAPEGSPGVSGDFAQQADTICGVERLQGNFAGNPGGWWEGARVYPNGSDWWRVKSAYGKQIAGTCYTDIQWPGF